MNSVIFQQSELLEKHGVIGGYFERTGGISPPPYHSLNTKRSKLVQDSDLNVEVNLRQALEFVNVKDGLYLQLVGGSEVITASKHSGVERESQHDGGVTNNLEYALMITVADCFPVLISDPANNAIGIAHCGWKGVQGGIVDKVIDQMKALGSDRENLIASIGPGICKNCYEVKDDVSDLFNDAFVHYKNDSIYLDLQSSIIDQLTSAGVNEIEVVDVCTYEHTDKLFSARKEKETGRLLSLIMQPST
jgi:YfiH family protein